MKYTLTYSRVGNTKAFYCLRDEYGAHVLCRKVEDVWGELALTLTRVRKLCRRAREGLKVEFNT